MDLIATMASLTVAIVNLVVALLSYATCFYNFFMEKASKVVVHFPLARLRGFIRRGEMNFNLRIPKCHQPCKIEAFLPRILVPTTLGREGY